jgi:hypothetical protein
MYTAQGMIDWRHLATAWLRFWALQKWPSWAVWLTDCSHFRPHSLGAANSLPMSCPKFLNVALLRSDKMFLAFQTHDMKEFTIRPSISSSFVWAISALYNKLLWCEGRQQCYRHPNPRQRLQPSAWCYSLQRGTRRGHTSVRGCSW